MRSLELHRVADQAELVRFRDATQRMAYDLQEHTRMGVDLTKDVYGTRGTVTDQMAAIENRFLVAETLVDDRITVMEGQVTVMRLHFDIAEAPLPMNGQVLEEPSRTSPRRSRRSKS